MNINFTLIKNFKKQATSKRTPTNTNDDLLKEILSSLHNSFDYINTQFNIHESCLWVESKANLLSNKGQVNTTKYNAREILLVDLGADTYGHEFSYEHPCIVIKNEYKRVFVVPCTSQPARRNSSGQVYPDFLEGYATDGFAKTTTILLKEAKYIDKTRIKRSLGKVKQPLYDTIYNKVFESLFESKSFRIKKLEQTKSDKIEEIKKISEEKEHLQEQLNIITEQYNKLKCEYDNYIANDSDNAVNQ
ncbi:type II toxin-antitoxin system PemK/MazF family toxin [Clostridium beijerinckii]|uniref:type II toxin-antitoxin system PemK/MazF family toxin n=1 Tax=Clostridium beijerinckii TaxID=1520 RepID=UPI00047D5965|nr:type II toxin-antitoxin system PemK/MazF family toxin [Clostridium beijerinckii]